MDRSDISCSLRNLANAKDEAEIFSILTELNILFESKHNNQKLREQLPQLDLALFFKQLNGLTGRSRECGNLLLGKVLSLIPSASVLGYSDVIIEGLQTEDENLKLLYLKHLEVASKNENEVELMVRDIDNKCSLLKLIAKNLSDNSINVAKLAATVIKNVLISCTTKNEALSESFMVVFIRLLDQGSVVRFRVYDLFVEIFLSKNDILRDPHVVSIFDRLMNEMNSNNVLTQLNCLDMLSQIACSSSAGLQVIVEKGVLENTLRIFKLAESDPSQGLLIPGAVKFFGNIAIKNPLYILPSFPAFVEFIFSIIKSEHSMLVLLGFETIANICTSAEGLTYLSDNTEQFYNAMRTSGQMVQSSIEEQIKKRILGAMCVLFGSDNATTNHSVSARKEKAYRNISQNPLALLMKAAKQPFPAVRCSSLEVLGNLVVYPWIEQDMAITPGFLEYLLDRRTEPEKLGKELKYGILRSLSKSPTLKDNCGVEYSKQICQYVKDGPFYSAQETAVDFEEAS